MNVHSAACNEACHVTACVGYTDPLLSSRREPQAAEGSAHTYTEVFKTHNI